MWGAKIVSLSWGASSSYVAPASLSHGEELLLLSQPLSQRYCTLLLPATALSVVPKLEPAHPIIPQCYQAA